MYSQTSHSQRYPFNFIVIKNVEDGSLEISSRFNSRNVQVIRKRTKIFNLSFHIGSNTPLMNWTQYKLGLQSTYNKSFKTKIYLNMADVFFLGAGDPATSEAPCLTILGSSSKLYWTGIWSDSSADSALIPYKEFSLILKNFICKNCFISLMNVSMCYVIMLSIMIKENADF